MMFNGWVGILRVALVGVPAYFCLILLIRVSGKRSLSKMNAFDLVVTVATGSVLGTILLSRQVALAEALAALVLLFALQFAVAFATSRWSFARRLVTAEPTLVALRGQLLHDAMRRERVAPDEVLSAVRAAGRTGLDGVQAVVLETDGSLSIVDNCTGSDGALKGVRGYPREAAMT